MESMNNIGLKSLDRSIEVILKKLENEEYDSEPELAWYDSRHDITEALKIQWEWIPPPATLSIASSRKPDWSFGMSDKFAKNIHNLDRKTKGSILDAINRICDAPMRPHGNTIKQLNGSKKGLWRYRIGDFRLIYFPNQKEKNVILMAFGPRSGIYN